MNRNGNSCRRNNNLKINRRKFHSAEGQISTFSMIKSTHLGLSGVKSCSGKEYKSEQFLICSPGCYNIIFKKIIED